MTRWYIQAIKMTPKQATKQKDNLKAKVNMTLQATKTRRYPEISHFR